MRINLITTDSGKPAINWGGALAFWLIVVCIAGSAAIAFYLVLTGAFPPASVLLLTTFFAGPLVVGRAIRAAFRSRRSSEHASAVRAGRLAILCASFVTTVATIRAAEGEYFPLASGMEWIMDCR